MNKWLFSFTITAGVVGLFFVVASWIVADVLIAPAPSKATWPPGLTYHPENVVFSSTDGIHLKGWFLPNPNSNTAIVLLHGVRANRDSMLERARWLHSLGYNVLLYDARGCGESDSVELSFGYHETNDLLAAARWLQARGMTQIGCIGSSQGAATILLASGQLPPAVRAIVAEAPYATLRNSVDDHFRAHTGLSGNYFGALVIPIAERKLGFKVDDVSPLREIPQLKVPLYLIGGASDTLAPVAGIQQLYDAACDEKALWIVQYAGHADFFSYAEDEYKHRVGDFLEKYLKL